MGNIPLKRIDEVLLEQQLLLLLQEIRHRIADLRLLDYYPELKGEFFNRRAINAQIKDANSRALIIIKELNRREIP